MAFTTAIPIPMHLVRKSHIENNSCFRSNRENTYLKTSKILISINLALVAKIIASCTAEVYYKKVLKHESKNAICKT